jgi:hypothetical protein
VANIAPDAPSYGTVADQDVPDSVHSQTICYVWRAVRICARQMEGASVEKDGDLLVDQLRQAIRECGMTKRELAEATGVAHILIVHFMVGRNLGIKEASKIAAYFGLDLRPKHALVPSS